MGVSERAHLRPSLQGCCRPWVSSSAFSLRSPPRRSGQTMKRLERDQKLPECAVRPLQYDTPVAIAMVHSDNRLASIIAMGIFATGVAISILLILAHDRPFTGEIFSSPGRFGGTGYLPGMMVSHNSLAAARSDRPYAPSRERARFGSEFISALLRDFRRGAPGCRQRSSALAHSIISSARAQGQEHHIGLSPALRRRVGGINDWPSMRLALSVRAEATRTGTASVPRPPC